MARSLLCVRWRCQQQLLIYDIATAAKSDPKHSRSTIYCRCGPDAVWSFSSGLEQSEQLQVSDVFNDDRCRDVRDIVVRANFRFLHRSTESVGRR